MENDIVSYDRPSEDPRNFQAVIDKAHNLYDLAIQSEIAPDQGTIAVKSLDAVNRALLGDLKSRIFAHELAAPVIRERSGADRLEAPENAAANEVAKG